MWGGDKDSLIPATQRQPSPDTAGSPAMLVAVPREAARPRTKGSPRGHALVPSQAVLHKSARERRGGRCFLRKKSVRNPGTHCKTAFLGNDSAL